MKRSTTPLALALAVGSLALGGSLAGPATASATTSIDIRNVNSGGVASIAYTISGRPWGNGYYDWGSRIDNVLG